MCYLPGEPIGASPEVAREMFVARRDKRFANFMDNPLFQCKLKALRLSLVEQRKNFFHAHKCAASDNVCEVGLVLLDITETFLELFFTVGSFGPEEPSDTVKKEVCTVASVSFVRSQENAGSN